MTKALRVLGLMSGTSLDGLDLCLCEINGLQDVSIVAFDTLALPNDLKHRIKTQMEPSTSNVQEICELNFDWSRYAAASVQRFLSAQSDTRADTRVDLIGTHGQTLYHKPPTSTLQIGDGGVLAALTGLTTVSQFRTADMALGGQGAPLVPFLDQHLFASQQESRVLLNIGGMANLTYLPHLDLSAVQAFDTGPGNVLVDVLARELTGFAQDTDGALALQGTPQQDILEDVLQHAFFAQPPPRSTGREVFGETYALKLLERLKHLSVPDILATVTAITVASVAQACTSFLPELPQAMYVSGGGVHNQAMLQGLRRALPKVKVASLQELGGHPDAKEAMAFAMLGYACLMGVPANVCAVTGASQPTVLGQIAPGKNWLPLVNYLSNIQETP